MMQYTAFMKALRCARNLPPVYLNVIAAFEFSRYSDFVESIGHRFCYGSDFYGFRVFNGKDEGVIQISHIMIDGSAAG